ncbi:MAG TPA: hypothetical protein VIY52_27195 [Streptosporangiaceae bacterium]
MSAQHHDRHRQLRRACLARAIWLPNTVNKFLQVAGFDVNASATFTVFLTASGKQIAAAELACGLVM